MAEEDLVPDVPGFPSDPRPRQEEGPKPERHEDLEDIFAMNVLELEAENEQHVTQAEAKEDRYPVFLMDCGDDLS